MGGAADLPQRSSSPLKRRASGMEPGQGTEAKEDVDMITLPPPEPAEGPREKDEGPKEDDARQEDVFTNGDPGSAPANDSMESESSHRPMKTGLPPIPEQIKTIETLLKAFAETHVQEGESAYLVSRQWLSRAQAFGADTKHAVKEAPQGALGPVDNADIIQAIFKDANGQEFVKLKPGLGSEHFELFPADAWDLVISWYGLASGQIPIMRIAHNTAADPDGLPNVQFEFYPPVLTIHRVWSAVSPIAIDQELKSKNPPPPVVVHSTSFGYMEFLKRAKNLVDVPLETKVRVWRVPRKLPAAAIDPTTSGMSTPPDSPGRITVAPESNSAQDSWPHLLLDVESLHKLEKGVERELLDFEDQTMNSKYNGSMSLSLAGLTVDQAVVIDESVEPKVFVSTYLPKSGGKDKFLAPRGSSSSLVAQSRGSSSRRNSPAPQGPMTRGRSHQKSGRTIGCVGLLNLGNTCYMNSALQCVRSVEELTKYFLTQEAEKEINIDNPLAHGGEVARAYEHLLNNLYNDPPPTSYAPRAFKQTIGRFAPSFSGYGQQDSQEFLGFLLDGLQEDLNRIKKKPYIEKPDSTDDMINNPVAIREMAEKVWDITKKRDDSVIADLFTGMYKSTLVCPVCQKVSITFDPFNNLTLPLPVANAWSRAAKFYPLNDAPVEITVDIDRNSSIKTMKEYVSARVGVPVARLFGAEEYREKFFKFYNDWASVSDEIQTNDVPAFHELEAVPTNVSNVAKKRGVRSMLDIGDDNNEDEKDREAMAERMVVPVLHRFNPDDPSYRKRPVGRRINVAVPPAHVIMLTPEEARSDDMIRRKVLEKAFTFTTLRSRVSNYETDTAENTDPEMVTAPTSDADSSGDSKFVAKSVEGEEDIVDVTMKDASASHKEAASVQSLYPNLLKKFSTRRPSWADPREFLSPELQNMFELSYFKSSGGGVGDVIPTGWHSVMEENRLPKLSTRIPQPPISDIDMQSPAAWNGGAESSDDDQQQGSDAPVTRMVDESSDEDSDFPHNQPQPMSINPRHNNNSNNKVSYGSRKKFKGHKTYGKKGNRRRDKQLRNAARPQLQAMQQAAAFPAVDGDQVVQEADGGPLIRLGEGLVVDWNEQAFEFMFGGTSADDDSGIPTYTNPVMLEDPQLEARKKQRALRKKHGITLDDCLDEFEKEEILSEQDTWYCPRCKEHRRASKKFDLWKSPDILVVHLKRFSSSGWRRDKLDILVEFPITGLDLTDRVIDKEASKQEIYDLIAVDDHWGGLGGGHYTAFAKNFVDGEWYEYNDSSVSKMRDTSRIVTPAAYLLFYRRRSEVPLGGPRFQEIFDMYDNDDPSDDEMASESGEGQRLGQGSSLVGPTSAMTGAEVVLHGENPGLASGSGLEHTPSRNVPVEDSPPVYSVVQLGDVEGSTSANNWGSSDDTIHNSVEDEGIDMADVPGIDHINRMNAMTSVIGTGWNWNGIGDGKVTSQVFDEGVDNDFASDEAQNDSSEDDALSLAGGAPDLGGDGDMDELLLHTGEEPQEPDAGYTEPEEPASVEFPTYPEPPPPDYAAQAGMEAICSSVWDRQTRTTILTVPADVGREEDLASERVDEIHIKDEDDAAGAGTKTSL